MTMVALNELLSPSELEPIKGFTRQDDEALEPDVTYAILEYYCDNPACDCQSLMALIVRMDASGIPEKKAVATIDYDWSTPNKRCRPTLSAESSQTDLAERLLKIYTTLVHSVNYQKRIKKDYVRVKQISAERLAKKAQPAIRGEAEQVGRNAPCPCGSGMKHKKCCL